MTLYIPAQSRDRSRVSKGRRRFDILTIGLHWATVTLIIGMFVSAWLLLASDREHAAMLLTAPFPWRGDLGGRNRPARLAIQLRLPAAISAEYVEGSTAARQDQ